MCVSRWFWRVGRVPLFVAEVLGLAIELAVPRMPTLAAPLTGMLNMADVGVIVAGARFEGIGDNDRSGVSVSSGGDINGDMGWTI